MTLKGDAKFKGKLTLGLKNYIRYLVNFHASNQKSGNLHFDGILLSKTYKDVQRYKNDMRNLVNFNASSNKSEKLHLDVLLPPKKCRRIFTHDTEK